MQIDSLGKRYGLLPSEVLIRADTFDLYVLDAALTCEKFFQDKQSNKGRVPSEYYSQDKLQQIFEKAATVYDNQNNR